MMLYCTHHKRRDYFSETYNHKNHNKSCGWRGTVIQKCENYGEISKIISSMNGKRREEKREERGALVQKLWDQLQRKNGSFYPVWCSIWVRSTSIVTTKTTHFVAF